MPINATDLTKETLDYKIKIKCPIANIKWAHQKRLFWNRWPGTDQNCQFRDIKSAVAYIHFSAIILR